MEEEGKVLFIPMFMFIPMTLFSIVCYPRPIGIQRVRSLGRIMSGSCYFFLCDIQEKFRPIIKYYPEIISVASKMVSNKNWSLTYFKYV